MVTQLVGAMLLVLAAFLAANLARHLCLLSGWRTGRALAVGLNLLACPSPTVMVAKHSRRYQRVAPANVTSFWNTEERKGIDNCYSVALSVQWVRSCLVGTVAVANALRPSLLRSYEAEPAGAGRWATRSRPSYQAFLRLLEGDGLVRSSLFNRGLRSSHYLVAALYEAGTGRYHFVRLGKDGTWLEKNGEESARILPGGLLASPTRHRYPASYLMVGYYWVNPLGDPRRYYAQDLGVNISNLHLV